jgi:small subunit ribosomal protein S3
MEERKFIRLKKEEYGIKEYIKRDLGKGKISKLDIEYTPLGEKIIVSTSRPGLVIGRKGEKIGELTRVLKTRFKLENPHIEIAEIKDPLFDAQLVADEIALALERMGNLRFKVIAYRKLQEIMNAGALGCELRLTGKLPSERAKSWRFAEGYLKKAGEPSKEIDRAQSTGLTKSGIIGIKVAIMAPDARIYDKIDIDEEIKRQINSVGDVEDEEKVKEKPAKKKAKKKVTKEVKEVIEKVDDKSNKKDKANLMEKGEVKVIKESPKVKEEEDGTAIMINEELEEGVPAEQIDEDIKEKIEEHKEKLEGEKDKKEEDVKDNVESEK